MLRNIFAKTLWEQRRSFIWWAIGLVSLSLYTAGLYPSIATPEFVKYMDQMPAAVTALLGEGNSMATIEGYLNGYFFDMMAPLIFVIYAIAAGSAAIAGEEERGTLDVLLATPTSRATIVLHKFAAMTVGTVLLGVFLWIGLALTTVLIDVSVNTVRLAEATLGSVLVSLLFGGLALALGAVRGSRGFSIGVAAVVTIVAYVVKVYAPLVESMKSWVKLSPFYYANAAKPLVNGLDLGHTALMLGVTLAFLVIALLAFERRDVAV